MGGPEEGAGLGGRFDGIMLFMHGLAKATYGDR
jgi:hypothetical protein